jgi:hypothetical protein
VRRAEHFSTSDYARKVLNKNTEKDMNEVLSIMLQITGLELIHPLVFLFHNGYYLLKNTKSINNLSCLEINNETAGRFSH